MKRMLALFLALTLAFACLPLTAFADGNFDPVLYLSNGKVYAAEDEVHDPEDAPGAENEITPPEGLRWNAADGVWELRNFRRSSYNSSLILGEDATLRLYGENELYSDYWYGIRSLGNLRIEGPGSLKITTDDDDAIYGSVDKHFTADGCTLMLYAYSRGLDIDESVTLRNCSLTIRSDADCIEADDDGILIENSTLDLETSDADGLDSGGDIEIYNSRVKIHLTDWENCDTIFETDSINAAVRIVNSTLDCVGSNSTPFSRISSLVLDNVTGSISYVGEGGLLRDGYPDAPELIDTEIVSGGFDQNFVELRGTRVPEQPEENIVSRPDDGYIPQATGSLVPGQGNDAEQAAPAGDANPNTGMLADARTFDLLGWLLRVLRADWLVGIFA